ncbi:heme exporter protein CcmD [Rhizobium sp. S95]|uniref:Heme exporter protein D n=1 Tax=Ciceribacter sichuanensis TaxID=2949647 RepID=A0AAJ1BWA6_9HYPH|nr:MULTISPECIES: heme exporter protein CcmD [unclassified Ciceribacter]MCM2396491.1 heme exporter protein CcmD [Ciceribacter sp. S95]MCM2402197.1 heme exporter protein CcmD [Ciceribacter sp. S153]MCO5957358.1 heme exporter protein CcmD [Ciceribacter sp. S101]
MSHAFYVYLSYGIAGLIILALIGWVWLDGRARQAELKVLEASGMRRRSASARVEGAGQ